MAVSEKVCIEVNKDITVKSAAGVVTRVRAAMQNEVPEIELHFAEGIAISSAEFLAFLAAAAQTMQSRGQRMLLKGVCAKNRDLFRISRLDSFLSLE